MSVALLFVCLALGRCTASCRTDNVDGANSAGWSLCSVAIDLVGSLLDVTSDSAISLLTLQVLTIMVVYLFRLDASIKAERTLAHAISSAHILGLHRKAFYTGLSAFDDEMFTRIWWCLYLQDRRISLETGRPFLIQDDNIETRNPLNVSDSWLTAHKTMATTLSELTPTLETETALARQTAGPYIEAYASLCRIATDVWKAVYNRRQASGSTLGVLHNYLDISLDSWCQSLPHHLKYNESLTFEDQFVDADWSQVKQCLSLHMRYAFLKLLVRKPFTPSSGTTTPKHTHIATEAYCAHQAASIIHIFDSIPETLPKYGFSFMHPLTSATMILYGIVFRNSTLRAEHQKTLLSAVRSLRFYCQKTWVSGKMIRTVSQLNAIVQDTFRSQPSDKQVEMRGRLNLPPWQPRTINKDGAVDADIAPINSGTAEHYIPGTTPSNYWTESNRMADARSAPRNEMSMPSPASTGPGQAQKAPDHTENVYAFQAQYQNNRYPLYSSTEPLLDLPDWATTDFDFEQAFKGYGWGNDDIFSSGSGFFNHDPEWSQLFRGSV